MAGRQKAALAAQASAVILYLALLYSLTRAFGLVGAGIAYLLGNILMAIFMLAPTLSSYWRRDAAGPIGRTAGAGL